MQDGVQLPGLLVTGNYFQVLGARPVIGRTLLPSDAIAPGSNAVAVLSEYAWRSRFGADPAIVGKRVPLGRQSFEVVGVIRRGMVLPGQQSIGFWAPLTMARAFEVADPWTDSNVSLSVIGRLRDGVTMSQARAWLDVWLRQRFPPGSGSELEPVVVHVDSRSRLIPLTSGTLTMLAVILSAFGLVLLVACANVTNLMLARGFSRQREIAVRLSLGASRWRVVRQLIVESLMLAVPAAAVGLALTIATARIFPALILATFPAGIAPVETVLVPLDPDWRVLSVLVIAAVVSAVIVSLAPAVRVTRANLVRAARGEAALDTQRSHLRTGLVAMQIGACVMFLICAIGLIDESRRLANPDRGLSYERVAEVRIAPRLRAGTCRASRVGSVDRACRRGLAAVARRRAATCGRRSVGDASRADRGIHGRVAGVFSAARHSGRAGPRLYTPAKPTRVPRWRWSVRRLRMRSGPASIQSVRRSRYGGSMRDRKGCPLTPACASSASLRMSRATYCSIRSTATCVYFATSVRSPLEMSLLVRSRADVADVRTAVVNAVNTLDPDAPYRIMPMRDLLGLVTWTFQAFSTTASLLGVVGLLLAFSGTYAVVAFLVAQRTPEFGIRMALGATVRQIVSAMMNETLRVALIGLGAGLALAMAVVRALSAVSRDRPAVWPTSVCCRCADCPCRHDGRGAIAVAACVAHRSVEGAKSGMSDGPTVRRGDGAAVRGSGPTVRRRSEGPVLYRRLTLGPSHLRTGPSHPRPSPPRTAVRCIVRAGLPSCNSVQVGSRRDPAAVSTHNLLRIDLQPLKILSKVRDGRRRRRHRRVRRRRIDHVRLEQHLLGGQPRHEYLLVVRIPSQQVQLDNPTAALQ